MVLVSIKDIHSMIHNMVSPISSDEDADKFIFQS